MAAPILSAAIRLGAGITARSAKQYLSSGVKWRIENQIRDGVRFTINDDITRLSNRLSNIQRQELPFATEMAFNKTVRGLYGAQRKEMRSVFDKPVSWTLRSLRYERAYKKQTPINARVFFAEEAPKGTPAYKYLTPNIEGGPRRQKRHEVLLSRKLGSTIYTAPAKDAPINAAGNITGGNYTRILAAVQAFEEVGFNGNTTTRSMKRNKAVRGYYVAKKGGRAVGVRQRVGGESKQILNFTDRPPTYRKRYDFYGLGDSYINKNLPRNFRSALRYALKNPKR